MNIWEPNKRMEDVKLLALASWLTHEEAKNYEIKRVMYREVNEPLWIIIELRGTHLVTSNHNIIFKDPGLVETYMEKQKHEILHFVDTFKLLAIES